MEYRQTKSLNAVLTYGSIENVSGVTDADDIGGRYNRFSEIFYAKTRQDKILRFILWISIIAAFILLFITLFIGIHKNSVKVLINADDGTEVSTDDANSFVSVIASTYDDSVTSDDSLDDMISRFNDLSVTISHEYGVMNQTHLPYSFLNDSIFAETYKKNVIQLDEFSHKCKYSYIINGLTDSSIHVHGTMSKGHFYFEPTKPGKYFLEIHENCAGEVTRTFNRTVWSKYVRREVSSLTDSDREEFLDAFAELWQHSTVEGQALYGDNYKSLWYFAVIHNDGGSSRVCDEFHKGSGFVNNHIYLGAYLEQSLQMINPRVALHYMEYVQYFENDFSARKFPSWQLVLY